MMNMKIFNILFVLFLMPSVAFKSMAQDKTSDEYINQSENVKIAKFDNGLACYSYMSNSDKPIVRMMIKAGYASENQLNRTALSFIKMMAENQFGQIINAEVNAEYTYFDIKSEDNSNESLTKAIQTAGNIASKLVIDETGFEKVQIELLGEINNPQSECRKDESFCKALFAGTKYCRDLKECLSGIKNMNASKLNKFYNEMFQAQNIALAVISPIESSKIENMISKEFASLKSDINKVNANVKPISMCNDVKSYVRYNADESGLNIYIKHLNYKIGSYKGYAADLSYKLLADLLTQKLGAKVEEVHLCNNLNALRITVSNTNNPAEAIESISKKLNDLCSAGMAESDLSTIKANYKSYTNQSLVNDITLNFAKEYPIYDSKQQADLDAKFIQVLNTNDINNLLRETISNAGTVISLNYSGSEKSIDMAKIEDIYEDNLMNNTNGTTHINRQIIMSK